MSPQGLSKIASEIAASLFGVFIPTTSLDFLANVYWKVFLPEFQIQATKTK